MLLKTLVSNLNYFPDIELESNILRPLEKLYPNAAVGRYFGASFIIAALLGIFMATLLALGGFDITTTALGAFGLFAVVLMFLMLLPSFELSRKTRIVEAEMPFTLRTIGMLRNMNVPFMKALAMAAEEEGEMAVELRKIVADVANGITLEKSLAKFAALFSSFNIKRALTQIMSAYELGSAGTEMRRIGDELLSVQQHEMKEYASKSAIFGMLFIVTAAVLPTFFLVYVLLGNFGVGGLLPRETIAVTLLLVFPALSVLLLFISKATMPYTPLSAKTNVLDMRVLAAAVLFVAAFLIEDQIIRIAGLVLGAAAILYVIYDGYKKEKRSEEIEQYLPDALFSVSALPKSTKLEKIFDVIAAGGYGALSQEAATAKRQISMNVKVDLVLDDLWRRNNSPALKKVCTMLKHAYNTNSLDQLHFIAEDLLKNFEIKRERATLMSMQKYTVLFGGLIIPMILKIAIALIGNLIQFFADGSAATDTVSYIISLIPAYLVVYSLIAAFYVADIEGKKSSAAIYFLLLVVVSMAVFNFISF